MRLVSIIRFLVFTRIIVVWLWLFLVNAHMYGSPFYLATVQSRCLMAIARYVGLSNPCHSCGFACQKRVLKTFPGPGYLRSEDGIVWLWHFLVNLHIYGSPFYLATTQSQYLMAIGKDGGLSTLCHSCGFACQQRVLKTFPGPGYLCSKDGIVWLWHFLVNLHIFGSPFYLRTAQAHYLMAVGRGGGLSTLCHSCRFGSISVP